MKLKLTTKPADSSAPPSVLPTPASATPSTGGGIKLKFKSSQPPTPLDEPALSQLPQVTPSVSSTAPKKAKKPKQPNDDATKKRPAQDDLSPAPKRPSIDTQTATKKRFSIKLGGQGSSASSTPTSAKIKLTSAARKASIGPKSISIVSRKYTPKRPIGVGYDSEASDAEDDPAIEQQWILRMEAGPDCDYLRDAIANKTLGEKPEAGGAYVNIKFLDKDLRRAVVTVNKTLYAAVMVDLPCIVEGMKSWDKRGWWKVADICQMLLVLGPTDGETTAKYAPLPREVDKNTFAYAHGLTPPMHWVRKRRFRQRASYKSVEHVDDEVERLIKADELAEKSGGTVKYDIIGQDVSDPHAQGDQDMDYYDEEEPADYRTTTEDAFGQAYNEPMAEEEDDEDLEGMLGAALFDEDMTEAPPLPPADAAAELGAVQTAMAEAETEIETEAPTPAAAGTPTAAQEASSDEDDDSEESDEDDDDDQAPGTIDEELVAEQAVQAQVREEIADLEKEVANARANVERSMNPMLRQRNINKLQSLESELAMKRRNFGMEVDDDDDEDNAA
jgi:transcription initiation factor TFIID subunit 7